MVNQMGASSRVMDYFDDVNAQISSNFSKTGSNKFWVMKVCYDGSCLVISSCVGSESVYSQARAKCESVLMIVPKIVSCCGPVIVLSASIEPVDYVIENRQQVSDLPLLCVGLENNEEVSVMGRTFPDLVRAQVHVMRLSSMVGSSGKMICRHCNQKKDFVMVDFSSEIDIKQFICPECELQKHRAFSQVNYDRDKNYVDFVGDWYFPVCLVCNTKHKRLKDGFDLPRACSKCVKKIKLKPLICGKCKVDLLVESNKCLCNELVVRRVEHRLGLFSFGCPKFYDFDYVNCEISYDIDARVISRSWVDNGPYSIRLLLMIGFQNRTNFALPGDRCFHYFMGKILNLLEWISEIIVLGNVQVPVVVINYLSPVNQVKDFGIFVNEFSPKLSKGNVLIIGRIGDPISLNYLDCNVFYSDESGLNDNEIIFDLILLVDQSYLGDLKCLMKIIDKNMSHRTIAYIRMLYLCSDDAILKLLGESNRCGRFPRGGYYRDFNYYSDLFGSQFNILRVTVCPERRESLISFQMHE